MSMQEVIRLCQQEQCVHLYIVRVVIVVHKPVITQINAYLFKKVEAPIYKDVTKKGKVRWVIF